MPTLAFGKIELEYTAQTVHTTQGGYILEAASCAIQAPPTPRYYYRHGWQSWSLAVWHVPTQNIPVQKPTSLHPMQIAPLIEDGDILLGESGAIVEYIIAKYAPDSALVPGFGHPDFADHLYWFHFANATFMTNGMMQIAVNAAGAQMPPSLGKRVTNAWAQIEDRLGKAEYFGGTQLTTADIMMVFQLTTSRAMSGMSIDGMPNLQAYLKRIGDLVGVPVKVISVWPDREQTIFVDRQKLMTLVA